MQISNHATAMITRNMDISSELWKGYEQCRRFCIRGTSTMGILAFNTFLNQTINYKNKTKFCAVSTVLVRVLIITRNMDISSELWKGYEQCRRFCTLNCILCMSESIKNQGIAIGFCDLMIVVLC